MSSRSRVGHVSALGFAALLVVLSSLTPTSAQPRTTSLMRQVAEDPADPIQLPVEVDATRTDQEPFGIACIAGNTWTDQNGDGIRQSDEPTSQAPYIWTISGASDRAELLPIDDLGRFARTDLRPGVYVVGTALLDNEALSPLFQGIDVTVDADIDPETLTSSFIYLSPGDQATTVGVGFTNVTRPPDELAISGRIWFDADGDGMQSPCDPGVAGATIDLMDGTVVVDSRTSYDDGSYAFPFDNGDYQIRITPPSGLDPVTTMIDLGPSVSTRQGLDAGFVAPAGFLTVRSKVFAAADSELQVTNPGQVDLTAVRVTVAGHPECTREIAELKSLHAFDVPCQIDDVGTLVSVEATSEANGALIRASTLAGPRLPMTGLQPPAFPDPEAPPTAPGGPPTTVPGASTTAPQATSTSAPPATTTSTTTDTTTTTTGATSTTTPSTTEPGPDVSPPSSLAASVLEQLRDSLTSGVVQVEDDRCTTEIDRSTNRPERPTFDVSCTDLFEGNEIAFRLSVVRSVRAETPLTSLQASTENTELGANPEVSIRTGSRMRATLSFTDDVQIRSGDSADAGQNQLSVVKEILPEDGYSFDFFIRPQRVGTLSGLLTIEALAPDDSAIEVAIARVELGVASSDQPISLMLPGLLALGLLALAGGAFFLMNRREPVADTPRTSSPPEAPESANSPATKSAATASVAASNAHKVFLSYSRSDLILIDSVAEALEAAGIDAWIDRSDIAGGERWKQKIVRGIKESSAVVLFLSAASIDSDNVAAELGLGRHHDKPIIPVLLEPGLELSDEFAYDLMGRQYAELFDTNAHSIDELVAVVKRFFTEGES